MIIYQSSIYLEAKTQFYDNLLLYCSVWNAFHKIIIITRINTWIRFNHKLNIRQPM